jgi:Holliday junction resolvasome RuvABC endonuclease subunit
MTLLDEPTTTGPPVLGLDLSITGTGVALPDDTTLVIRPRGNADARLVDIEDRIIGILDADRPQLVVIEGPVLRSNAAIPLAMLHGVIRARLIRRSVPYCLVPPATLKVYATGSGNTKKPQMAVAAYKRAQREFRTDDECDAAWLRWAGLDLLGAPAFQLPKEHRRALAKLTYTHHPTQETTQP